MRKISRDEYIAARKACRLGGVISPWAAGDLIGRVFEVLSIEIELSEAAGEGSLYSPSEAFEPMKPQISHERYEDLVEKCWAENPGWERGDAEHQVDIGLDGSNMEVEPEEPEEAQVTRTHAEWALFRERVRDDIFQMPVSLNQVMELIADEFNVAVEPEEDLTKRAIRVIKKAYQYFEGCGGDLWIPVPSLLDEFREVLRKAGEDV